MTEGPSEADEIARARQIAAEERARRAEQSDEADRRARVRRTLARQDLYSMLEPASPDLDQEENALTERLQPGMTLETALAAEIVGLVARGLVPVGVSGAGVSRRLFDAYDEESAGRVRDLPVELLTAERVYAHLVSLSGLEKLPAAALTTLARRATILLYNRRWLAPDGGAAPVDREWGMATLGAISSQSDAPIRASRPTGTPLAPKPKLDDELDNFCVDCGRSLLPGEVCSCAKTVSLPEPAPEPAPAQKPAPPLKPLRRDKPYADRTLVLNPHGLRDPDAQPGPEPEHERRAAEARVVEGYVRVTTDLTFATKDPSTQTGRGVDVILRAGVVVEQMEPSALDLSNIRKKAEAGIQVVTIRWMGKIRLVQGDVLVPASRAEWAAQEREAVDALRP